MSTGDTCLLRPEESQLILDAIVFRPRANVHNAKNTSCIDFQVCASYTVEVGCFEGTDGLCIYALPIGQTTGTMACRVKVCEDLILDTSISCKIALFETKLGTKCVSNGTTCIVENTCSLYKSKEACNGGGTDGNCAYTPVSITTGKKLPQIIQLRHVTLTLVQLRLLSQYEIQFLVLTYRLIPSVGPPILEAVLKLREILYQLANAKYTLCRLSFGIKLTNSVQLVSPPPRQSQ